MKYFFVRWEYIQGVKSWWIEMVMPAMDIRTGLVATHKYRVASGFTTKVEANDRVKRLEEQLQRGGLRLTAF